MEIRNVDISSPSESPQGSNPIFRDVQRDCVENLLDTRAEQVETVQVIFVAFMRVSCLPCKLDIQSNKCNSSSVNVHILRWGNETVCVYVLTKWRKRKLTASSSLLYLTRAIVKYVRDINHTSCKLLKSLFLSHLFREKFRSILRII